MIPLTQFSIKLNKDIIINGEYEGNDVLKKAVIFSHGFGVRRDSRGMYNEIGDILKKEYLIIRFDYTKILGKNNLVYKFSKMASILDKVIQYIEKEFNIKEINIIAHSMGCLITGILNPKSINKIILLAPPADSPYTRMKEFFSKRKGTVINESGRSRIKRSDGTWTYIDADFWPEVKDIDPKNLYTNLAGNSDVTIIRAASDELINDKIFCHIKNISGIKYFEIETNHNFEGEGRKKLLQMIKSLF